jgi:uncharacterized protein (TIGR00369 family)
MVDLQTARKVLLSINDASPFNRFAGFELIEVESGFVRLALSTGPSTLNQAGTLHAGVQSGFLETAGAFAAGLVAQGQVVTIQMSLSFLAPASGTRFEAAARVLRASKSHVFVDAQLTSAALPDPHIVAVANLVLRPFR